MTATDLFASSPLVDDELTLLLSDTHAAGPRENDALTYRFAMQHSENGARIGNLSVRIADSEYIVQYFGHIGYGVHPLFRGHRYAARACRLSSARTRAPRYRPDLDHLQPRQYTLAPHLRTDRCRINQYRRPTEGHRSLPCRRPAKMPLPPQHR